MRWALSGLCALRKLPAERLRCAGVRGRQARRSGRGGLRGISCTLRGAVGAEQAGRGPGRREEAGRDLRGVRGDLPGAAGVPQGRRGARAAAAPARRAAARAAAGAGAPLTRWEHTTSGLRLKWAWEQRRRSPARAVIVSSHVHMPVLMALPQPGRPPSVVFCMAPCCHALRALCVWPFIQHFLACSAQSIIMRRNILSCGCDRRVLARCNRARHLR